MMDEYFVDFFFVCKFVYNHCYCQLVMDKIFLNILCIMVIKLSIKTNDFLKNIF